MKTFAFFNDSIQFKGKFQFISDPSSYIKIQIDYLLTRSQYDDVVFISKMYIQQNNKITYLLNKSCIIKNITVQNTYD